MRNSSEKKSLFDDNISNCSDCTLSENDENRDKLSINQFSNGEHIHKMKKILSNDYQKILPNDLEKLKKINENLYKNYKEISDNYNNILQAMNEDNENLRKKAENYYNNYKEIKKQLYKDRIDLHNKNKILKSELALNNQQNNELIKNINDFNIKQNHFNDKLQILLGTNDVENLAVLSSSEDQEMKILGDALKKISNMGIDITKDLNISEEDLKVLSVIIGANLEPLVKSDEKILSSSSKKHDNENEDEQNYENQDDINLDELREDFDLGNQIVSLIERDVNDLYISKKIEQVKIDQVDAIDYTFSGFRKEEKVTLLIKDDALVTKDGQAFADWLIDNFKITPS